METIQRLFLLLALVISVGCSHTPQTEPEDPAIRTGFVATYYDVDGITATVEYTPLIGGNSGKTTPGWIKILANPSGNIYDYTSRGAARERYDELCEKHDDLTFGEKFGYNMQSVWKIGLCSVDFVSVSIKSDAAWDAEHPAGTELNDIVVMHVDSPLGYIRDGYNGETTRSYGNYLSKFTPEKLTLLGNGRSYELATIWFFVITEPMLSNVHNFTVTLTTDDGRTFEDTVQVEW